MSATDPRIPPAIAKRLLEKNPSFRKRAEEARRAQRSGRTLSPQELKKIK